VKLRLGFRGLGWWDGPASSRATPGIEEFTDVPSISVSEKGSNKTRISNESSVHEDELDGPEGAGRAPTLQKENIFQIKT